MTRICRNTGKTHPTKWKQIRLASLTTEALQENTFYGCQRLSALRPHLSGVNPTVWCHLRHRRRKWSLRMTCKQFKLHGLNYRVGRSGWQIVFVKSMKMTFNCQIIFILLLGNLNAIAGSLLIHNACKY